VFLSSHRNTAFSVRFLSGCFVNHYVTPSKYVYLEIFIKPGESK